MTRLKILILFIVTVSCSIKEVELSDNKLVKGKSIPSECIAMNDSALMLSIGLRRTDTIGFQQVIGLYGEALDCDNDLNAAYYNRALLYLEHGYKDKCLKDLDTLSLREQFQNKPLLYHYQMKCLIDGDLTRLEFAKNKALELYKAEFKKYKTSGALMSLVLFLAEIGEKEKAINLINRNDDLFGSDKFRNAALKKVGKVLK